jgi:hypothetical protein
VPWRTSTTPASTATSGRSDPLQSDSRTVLMESAL